MSSDITIAVNIVATEIFTIVTAAFNMDMWILLEIKDKLAFAKAIVICTCVVGYIIWMWLEDK